MPNRIIQEFASRMEARIQEITAEFMQKLDFKGLEAAFNEECAKLNVALQQILLQNLLLNIVFLSKLRIYAGKLGMRFKEYRRITITLSNGQKIEIISPYFVKAEADKRRRKRKRIAPPYLGMVIWFGYRSVTRRTKVLVMVFDMQIWCAAFSVPEANDFYFMA